MLNVLTEERDAVHEQLTQLRQEKANVMAAIREKVAEEKELASAIKGLKPRKSKAEREAEVEAVVEAATG